MAYTHFEFPLGWQLGTPAAVLLLAFSWYALKRRGIEWKRILVLSLLRGILLFALIILVSRPVSIKRDPPNQKKQSIILLFDKSESMSLVEDKQSRYERMVQFARSQLLPLLEKTGWQLKAFLFSNDVESSNGEQIVSSPPNGKRTNLGKAIKSSLASASDSPVAIIALTDGIANDQSENSSALSALVETKVPFIGIGFGKENEVKTLSLRRIEGPSTVAPNREFKISAQLEMLNSDDTMPFELVLTRGGQFLEKKTINPGKGSRYWMENFSVTEKDPGVQSYSVQLMPPNVPGLLSVNTQASTAVRITEEKDLRVLYVQGALTWDYKFINLALMGDSNIKLTGLTKTSDHSIFRQNVENATELTSGFPTTIEELAPYRVIVLSNLKPKELSPEQQELLFRFCSELGGGVLMIGGSDTFNASWQGSRLEQMLPVVFSDDRGVQGLDQPFHLRLTEDALQHSVFQIRDDGQNRTVWEQLPSFQFYGRVDQAKPGAQVWAFHSNDVGPKGPRILMANQRFGSGISAVICFQNFWKWRLAKDSDPLQFNRFWKQLFRYLGEINRMDVSISFADQDLSPRTDIHFTLERQPQPKSVIEKNDHFAIQVVDPDKKSILKQDVDLMPKKPVDFSFRPETNGIYTVTVEHSDKSVVATRSIEIKEPNFEFQKTGRNMETLLQWASMSNGLAVKAEECSDAKELINQIRDKIEQAQRIKKNPIPLGINLPIFLLLLSCLLSEWILKKHWNVT